MTKHVIVVSLKEGNNITVFNTQELAVKSIESTFCGSTLKFISYPDYHTAIIVNGKSIGFFEVKCISDKIEEL